MKQAPQHPASPASLRQAFPIFRRHPELVYLDSAATTQKPESVMDAERHFYEHTNANVHRGAYRLADEASRLYESVREKVRHLLHASDARQIVFTSGATAGINLVAQGFAADLLTPGDAILISAMEHHANLIPWQQVCQQKQARLLVIPVSPAGVLDLEAMEHQLEQEAGRVKMLAVTHISNTLGTVNPIREIIELAHRHGARVLIDAAQSVSTHQLDVQALELDFLVFSGHKMFGPTGTGILYGKPEWLEAMRPVQFGGGMIRDVQFEKTVFAPPPQRFEAGTPNLAGIAGLGAAVDWIQETGQEVLARHATQLLDLATDLLPTIPGLRIIGQAPEKSGILSFVFDDIHPHDMATFLDRQHICVRAGHHCTQPLMDFLEIPGTVRASFSIYNTPEEIEWLAKSLREARTFFS